MREGKMLVLVVDDEIGEVIKAVVGSFGCAVVVAENLKLANEYVESLGVLLEVMILDFQLKDGNTLKLIQGFREKRERKEVSARMIACNGGNGSESQLQLEAGCDVVIRKPFGMTELKSALGL